MPASPNRLSPDLGDPAPEEAAVELRQLVADVREASRDGRLLVERYASLLTKVIDEYCAEFEARAEAALARLEAVR
jgi:hypothetical protein